MLAERHFFRSLTQASLSYSLVGAFLSFELNRLATTDFTYPEEGPLLTDSIYSGPITSELVPFQLDIGKNITIDIPFINVSLLIQQTANAKAAVNVSYGGGLFFKGRNKVQPMIVAPALFALGTHAAGTFFERKANRARDARIADSHDAPYGLIT